MEEEQSFQSDEHILCDDCDKLYKGDCPIHGALEWIKDTSAVSSSQYSPSITSLPDGLLLKESSIPDANMGVFAATIIHKRVMFGPFQGRKVLPEELEPGQNLTYSWDVLQNGVPTSVLHGFDDKQNNWMQYVAYARDKQEQNLIAFQYCGQIYYRTFRDIYPGEELVVWFEDEYCCSIDDLPEEFSGDEVPAFSCVLCRLVFAGATYVYKHHKFRCPDGPLSSTFGAKPSGLVGALFRLPVEVPSGNWPNKEAETVNNSQFSTSPEAESHQSRRKSKPRKLARQVDPDELWNPEKLSGPPPASFLAENCTSVEQDSATLVMLPPEAQALAPSSRHGAPGQVNDRASLKRSAEMEELFLPEKQCRYNGGEYGNESPDNKHPYACGECGKTFARPTWWAKHESSHSCNKKNTTDAVLPHKPETESEIVIKLKPLMKQTKMVYKCDQCPRSFACPSWLKRHNKVHGNPSGIALADKSPAPSLSVDSEVDSRPYVCHDCGRRFAVPAWLTRHRMSHHKSTFSKPHKCGICGRSFAVAYWLIRHQKMHHNVENTNTSSKSSSAAPSCTDEPLPWKCGECGLAFRYSSWLRRHQRNNGHNKPRPVAVVIEPNSDRPFVCDRKECGKTFATRRQFGRHRRRHVKNDVANGKIVYEEKTPVIPGPPFICSHPNCQKSFSARHLYMRHKRRHQKNTATEQSNDTGQTELEPQQKSQNEHAQESIESIDCDEHCNEKGLSEEHHSKYHNETETVVMNKERSQLEDNTGDSAKGPPYKCTHCSKVFSYDLLLKRHVARHRKNENTKKKLFKGLNIKSSLIPEGEQNSSYPHVCEVCNASFKDRYLWNRHMVKHLSGKETLDEKKAQPLPLKRYSCDECGKSFAASFWLTRHRREHNVSLGSTEVEDKKGLMPQQTEKRRFVCDECGKTFAASFWLTRHKKGHAQELQSSEIEKQQPLPTEVKPDSTKTGPRKHTCDECGRSFAVAFWLTRHKKVHVKGLEDKASKEELSTPDVPAPTSEPAFTQPKGVMKNGRTVYECPDCDRDFHWPSWLVKHRRIHQRAQSKSTQDNDMLSEQQVEQTYTQKNNNVQDGEMTINGDNTKTPDHHTSRVRYKREDKDSSKAEAKTLRDMKASECYEVFGDVGMKQYRCKICNKTSAWHTGIIYHVRVHHTHERPFQCQVCMKAFHMAGDLTKHAKRHSGEKPFPCPCKGCDKCFATAQHARRHATAHKPALLYRCSNCNKRYRDRSSLWKHKLNGPCSKAISDKQKVTQAAPPPLAPTKPKAVALSSQSSTQCSICNKQFEDTGSLWGHRLRMHPNMLLGTCKRCGKRKDGGHSCNKTRKDSKLTCYRCGESFTDRDEYRSHLSTHKSGEKIVCEYCGKSWLRKADLTRHLRVHTGERPYPCPDCGLAFKVSDGLKRHMRSLHPTSTKDYVKLEPQQTVKQEPTSDDQNKASINENQTKDLSSVVKKKTEKQKSTTKLKEKNKKNNNKVTTKLKKATVDKESSATENDETEQQPEAELGIEAKGKETNHKEQPLDEELGTKDQSNNNESQMAEPSKSTSSSDEGTPEQHSSFTISTSYEKQPQYEQSTKSPEGPPKVDELSNVSCNAESEVREKKESIYQDNEVNKTTKGAQGSSKGQEGSLVSESQEVKRKKRKVRKKMASLKTSDNEADVSKKDDFDTRSPKAVLKKLTNKQLAGRKCKYCGKVFSLPGNLARHVRLHTGEKPFACKMCGESFMRSDVLGQHRATFHENSS